MSKKKAAVLAEKQKSKMAMQPEKVVAQADVTSVAPVVKPEGDLKLNSSLPPAGFEDLIPRESYKVNDNRKIDMVTNKPLSDTNRLNYSIDMQTAKEIISAAKRMGANPFTALAISFQETGAGGIKDKHNDSVKNPMRVHQGLHGEIIDNGAEKGIEVMLSKFDMARKMGKMTEAEMIQAYNGYGKVGKNTEGRQKMMYGIDVSKSPIDMSKNPIYGKRIIDIRDNILKKDPKIVKLVEETR